MSSDYVFVLSDGTEIPVVISTRRGLRNITLRPKTGARPEIRISKPWLTPTASALRFLEQKRDWCQGVFERAPKKTQIIPGMQIEILGRMTEFVHDPTRRANQYVINGNGTATLIVGGGADMFSRRVRDWLRAEFLSVAKQMIRSAPRELWPRRVSVRDTTTRWGSCSSTGTMSFSWRLAFAPTDVMRYVVMHELAHRRHMDHSPAFWKTVGELYGFGVERARRWLNKNGAELHKYF